MPDIKQGGVLDSIIKGIGEAVTDVRQKVVEEGYFGRQVTPDLPQQSPYAEQGLPASFEQYRASKDAPEKGQSKEQDKGQDKELGE
jgi:hypothetical protein